MSQAPKKPSHTSSSAPKIVAKAAHSAANITSKAVEKVTKNAISTLETTHQSAKSVAELSTGNIKEFFANSSEEAKKTHAKVFAINRESTEAFSHALDALTRTINDLVTLNRESVDVAVEVSNIVNEISRTTNAEILKYANSNFSDNLDICNEALGCRNINDAIEISNKWFSSNINSFFSQSARLADMLFQFANEASEPVNDHILESAERLSKSLAA